MKRIFFAWILSVVTLATSSTYGDMVLYGDFAGDSAEYSNVREYFDVGSSTLFDPPTVSGDSLHFGMSGFDLASVGGSFDFINGQLRLNLDAEAGYQIDSLSLEEFGSYFKTGAGSVSMSNLVASATVDGTVYSGNTLFQSGGGPAGTWSQQMDLIFPAAQSVSLVIDSQLFTAADPAGVSFINKQGFFLTAHTNFSAVPEPSSAILLGLAGAFAMIKRRRSEA